MQFLISVLGHTTDFATDEEMAAIDAFNDRLIAEGHWASRAGSPHPARPPSSISARARHLPPTGRS